jgi:hypothetical protein
MAVATALANGGSGTVQVPESMKVPVFEQVPESNRTTPVWH